MPVHLSEVLKLMANYPLHCIAGCVDGHIEGRGTSLPCVVQQSGGKRPG